MPPATNHGQTPIMLPPESPPQLEYPYAARPPVSPAARPATSAKPITPAATWPSPGPTWLPLIGAGVVFVLANFFVVPFIEWIDDESFLVFWCVGVMLAEGFVLAAWLVWGDRPFLQRLLVHWVAAAVLGAVWLLGAIATEGFRDGDIRDILEVIPFSLPLFSLAIQLPLWIARYYFGWRLVDTCADRPAAKPMGTRDLMLGTVIVAVSLALARLAEGMDDSSEGWLIWAILAPSIAGISLVSVLPVAVWLLRMRNPALGLICIPVQTTIAILVTVTIIAVNEPSIRLEEVFFIATTIVGFAAALTAAALAARVASFRLQIGPGVEQPVERDA
jgi:hypothetical protein